MENQINRRTMLGAGAALAATASIASSSLAQAKPNSLSGQSVLITGCSSGFGYLTALHCARLGAKVVASMRNLPRPEADTLHMAAKDLDLHIVEIDVTDDTSVTAGTEAAISLIGGAPDILINNAGLAIVGPLEAQDLDATRLIYETNVFGYQRMIRAVLPGMRHRGSGHIVNMSSQSGRLIWPGLGHYCPTKFAVEAMSDTLAYEVADKGVDVTLIQPGGYPTAFWNNRETLTGALKKRSDPKHLNGYGAMSDNMGSGRVPQLTGDPMDVPEAIARSLVSPQGQRPHRVMVSASRHPQETINQTHRETHLNFLGRGPFGDAARKVHNS
ncbi:SDR family oxidoreductase [Epibacterium ulvae]|uniref:SDR family oxidoreductase n=1 Tax=Epibacterium ulvae TaxID=1156985 RepID=UPI002492A401|nr:SDR family oxidoreductase [Epibacterium ulvae]